MNELEKSHGGLQDARRLREVLKQNTFLLGMELQKNKNMVSEMKFMKLDQKRLVKEKVKLDEDKRDEAKKAAIAESKLYDIADDPY